MATEEKHPLPIDASTDNGASSNIGWYNKETDNWDKDEPDLPAFMKKDDK